MFKDRIKNKGFTLIELVLAIALVSIVILISTNMFMMGIKSHSMSIKEYDLQSSIRIATEEINKVARYSKAVFAVPQNYINEGAMDSEWNYFMVSDKKRIVSMEYNPDKKEFEERILVPEQNNIEYEVFFEKVENASLDNILKYVIKSYTIDSNGNRSKEEKILFESAVESINAVQVIDKGTGISDDGTITQSTSVALAYKNNGQSSGKGNEYAYITLIVDVSGSMRLLPTDIDAEVNVPKNDQDGSRMQKVREALTGIENSEENKGIIEQFANHENVFVSLIPFSTTANYPSPIANLKVNENFNHPIYDVHYNKVYSDNDASKETLKQEVSDKLNANGGTNTGDGLRRAYHLHKNFRNRMDSIIKENERVHHYMILLVDGQSTYETATKAMWEDNGYYSLYERFILRDYYQWKVNYMPIPNRTTYYELDKNITISTKYPSNLNPKNEYNYFIKDRMRYYGEARDNTSTSDGLAVIGTGNTFVGTGYVDKIGRSIKSFNNNKGIKSYVIGYATGLQGRVKEIGKGIGTEDDKIFSYDDDDFDLQEVFESIADDILADYWVLAGPQIKD